MGIDARIVIKYRGEKPTQDQLTRWSWDLCRAVGARHFFISDGLPAPEYNLANDAWHKAFKAHAVCPQLNAARNGPNDEWQRLRQLIVADIGEAPQKLRRGHQRVALCCALEQEFGIRLDDAATDAISSSAATVEAVCLAVLRHTHTFEKAKA